MTDERPQDPCVALDRVTARAKRVTLGPLTFTLDPGAHALVGTKDDGTSLLLETIAGRARTRSGRLTVLGGAPARASRAIAHVPREVALPEVLRVSEVLAMAAQVRGEPARDPLQRLTTMGIAELAQRNARTLTPDEARAVMLCEALTSNARLILVDEPYASLDPRAAAHLADAVRHRASEGACVLVATASLREAAELTSDQLVLQKGVIVHRARPLGHLLAPGAHAVRLRVVTNDPRALLAALASETAAASIEATARSVVVSGPDPVAMAEAIARAVVRAGVDVESLRTDAPMVDELRATLAAEAEAAYRTAKARPAAAHDGRTPPSAPPAQPPPSPPPSGGPT